MPAPSRCGRCHEKDGSGITERGPHFLKLPFLTLTQLTRYRLSQDGPPEQSRKVVRTKARLLHRTSVPC